MSYILVLCVLVSDNEEGESERHINASGSVSNISLFIYKPLIIIYVNAHKS